MHDEVSATELRRRLAAGEDCPGLLPPVVAEYIREHGLYRAPSCAPAKRLTEAAGEH